jgi:hypothetical protein
LDKNKKDKEMVNWNHRLFAKNGLILSLQLKVV